jgi:hypothetical protein
MNIAVLIREMNYATEIRDIQSNELRGVNTRYILRAVNSRYSIQKCKNRLNTQHELRGVNQK